MAADTLRYFIDANVFIYAVGRDSEYQGACSDIIVAIGDDRLGALTDAEMVQELIHRYHRRGRLGEAAFVIRRLMAVIPEIQPVLPDDVQLALELALAHPQLSASDAVHYAVMRRVGVSHIITADKHFAGLPAVVRVDPRDVPL
jgi:uncharacterized protein